MIYTARQLDQLFKAHGHLALPPDARLTPLATDWVRSRRLPIVWTEKPREAVAAPASGAASAPAGGDPLLWWCDGPCGQAKAAISSFERSASLQPLGVPSSELATVDAVRAVADAIRSGRCRGAILLVRAAGVAVVYANRSPSIRAVLGTCLEAVDQAASSVGANVLVIEHPYKAFSQLRTLVGRFVRGPFVCSDAVQRQLKELASCD